MAQWRHVTTYVWRHQATTWTNVAWRYRAICKTSADTGDDNTYPKYKPSLMKQQVGLGLYSVTTCTGDILWRFKKIAPSGNRLHYSHYKQYIYAITTKAKMKSLALDNVATSAK